MDTQQIDRLIQWLRNASVTHFVFTTEGKQEVCKPKYLLTRDRDLIIGLLEKEKSNGQSAGGIT
jgi:hypothetical protein